MMELDSNTFKEAIQSSTPVIVDFWAAWCMPCKIFAPVLEELSGELEGKAQFCKVNIDDCGDLAQEYSIVSIPTLIIYKNGEAVERLVGVQKKEDVLELINKCM